MANLTVTKTQRENPLIGDDLQRAFFGWAEDKQWDSPAALVRVFCRWLVEEPTGAEALKYLNSVPRQLVMDFMDREPPWEVVSNSTMEDGPPFPVVDDEGNLVGWTHKKPERAAKGDKDAVAL